MPIRIQVDAAQKRLAAFAREQLRLVEDGWEIVQAELGLEALLRGVRVRGKIDRIDRHRESGAWRVIDYKTSDKAITPAAAHWGGANPATPDYALISGEKKNRCWIDLQLPLYAYLLEQRKVVTEPVSMGYLNLPKAITETGLSLWSEYNETVLRAAQICAEGVVRDVQNQRFWPPVEKIPYDDFARLFPMGVEACVNGDKLKSLMRGESS